MPRVRSKAYQEVYGPSYRNDPPYDGYSNRRRKEHGYKNPHSKIRHAREGEELHVASASEDTSRCQGKPKDPIEPSKE